MGKTTLGGKSTLGARYLGRPMIIGSIAQLDLFGGDSPALPPTRPVTSGWRHDDDEVSFGRDGEERPLALAHVPLVATLLAPFWVCPSRCLDPGLCAGRLLSFQEG